MEEPSCSSNVTVRFATDPSEAAVFGIRAGRAAATEPAVAHTWPCDFDPEHRVVQSMIAEDPRRINGHHRTSVMRIGTAASGVSDASGDVQELKSKLRAILIEGAGIERCTETVTRALARHGDLRDQIDAALASAAPTETFSLDGMYVLSGLILQASKLRTESRGAHFRADYPEQDPTWDRHIAFVCEPATAGATQFEEVAQ